MQKFIKTTLLVSSAAAFMGSQAAHAQIAANDLIIGFNQQGVSSSDYVIDLGNASTAVGVGGSQVINLSSSVSMSSFNAAFAGAQNGVAMGVVGGNNGTGTKDVFLTQLRTIGNPNSLPGSSSPTQPSSAAFISTAASAANTVSPLGVSPSSGSTSWSSEVSHGPNDDPSGTAFLTALGINPMSTISSGSIIQDLWHDNRVGTLGQTGWIYDGYFTLTFLDANTESLTFTPAAFVPVPEPTTCGLVAGAGLLMFSLRRQLIRKSV